MYVISNKQLEDIQTFLAAFKSLPSGDNKMYNLQRRAGLTLKKMDKVKPISQQQFKDIQDECKIRNSKNERD